MSLPGCRCLPRIERDFLRGSLSNNIYDRERSIEKLRTGIDTDIRQNDIPRIIVAHTEWLKKAKFVKQELDDTPECIE